MECIEGYVDKVRFYNSDNGFAIFDLVSDDFIITCKGCVMGVEAGEELKVTGDIVFSDNYGEQFAVSSYEHLTPSDEIAIRRYLASGAIRGVGEKMAARIVDRFGSETMHVLEYEPEKLEQVKGISIRIARDIAVQYKELKEARAAFMFLQQYGISNTMCVRIYEEYGESIYTILKENPYKLAEDIRGIGFKTADEIATKTGIKVDSQYRIRAGILYVISEEVAEGNMYITMEDLKKKGSELLDVSPDMIESETVNLSVEKKTIIKNPGIVYASEFYYAELRCAAMLHDLNISAEKKLTAEENESIELRITRLEHELGMEFESLQRQAVKAAALNCILILSGGPGTGKTTTINALIRYFADEGMDIMLAAPTGRAAKRMTEATGYEAKTIHRMLELSGAPDDDRSRARFERNDENPLETDVIIVDEMSMVDIFLFQSLLRAVSPGTRLIMVGDVDQLPSVGPGQVLKDLIDSGAFKTVMLERIFRQTEGSDIVANAHDIRVGRYPKLDNESSDFFFLKRNDSQVIYKHMVELILDKLPGYVEASSMDIQVLTPMRKGELGAVTLNRILQRFLNPESDDKKETERGDMTFREGDKVMQIRNNYQMEWTIYGQHSIPLRTGTGVFNGDMGRIVRIDDIAKTVRVEFDENRVAEYEYKMLDDLELAYAVTIHKSQGSEYPAVIIPVLSGPTLLFNRNLLYTAITRARKTVVILGREDTIKSMVDNDHVNMRHTGLAERIREVCP